jgi:hypothetical protein
MTRLEQVQEDLSYIREAVARRTERRNKGETIYLIWAAYVLIGYVLIDVNPVAAGVFFVIGSIPAAALSWWLGRRARLQSGEIDHDVERRSSLHWIGGFLLCCFASFGLAAVIPPLRNMFFGSQVFLAMVGLLYFLHGVHFDRHFLWLGPLLIVGSVVVGMIPVFPWTCLGLVISAGLCVPYLLARRKREQIH